MRRLLVLSMAGLLPALVACQKSADSPQTAPAPAAPAANAPANIPMPQTHAFQCGDLKVTATFDGVGAVDLGYEGGPLTLPQVESASGARYADNQGNEFWNKGDEATFTLGGKEKRDCRQVAPAGEPSAAAR
jgi:membrane-bound inhibitor of C-type lysozyme